MNVETDIETMDKQSLQEATEKLGLTGASTEDKLKKYVEVMAMAGALRTETSVEKFKSHRAWSEIESNESDLGACELLALQDTELSAALSEQKDKIEQRIQARTITIIGELSGE